MAYLNTSSTLPDEAGARAKELALRFEALDSLSRLMAPVYQRNELLRLKAVSTVPQGFRARENELDLRREALTALYACLGDEPEQVELDLALLRDASVSVG